MIYMVHVSTHHKQGSGLLHDQIKDHAHPYRLLHKKSRSFHILQPLDSQSTYCKIIS